MTAILFCVSSAYASDYKTKITLSIAAASPTYDETYTLTIPESLAVQNSGWNEIGSITVKHDVAGTQFDPSKQLVITASSANTFKLKATGVDDEISYFLATGADDTGPTTTFKFTAAEINTEGGTSKTIGVNVEDYSTKHAGNYEDEITYAVNVVPSSLITWDFSAGGYTINPTPTTRTFTDQGVTITSNSPNSSAAEGEFNQSIFSIHDATQAKIEIAAKSGLTFTNTLGKKFTKIVMTNKSTGGSSVTGEFFGNSWSYDGSAATWTGNADSVEIFTNTDGGVWYFAKMEFTLEQPNMLKTALLAIIIILTANISTANILIPGYETLHFKAKQIEQDVIFRNPEENNCYFKISINLADGTNIWTADDVLNPGEAFVKIDLERKLERGIYRNALMKYECYTLEDNIKLNGAELRVTIEVN